MHVAVFVVPALLVLAACAPPPPVEQSRGLLWQRFGGHSLDDVLVAWGAPATETKLTTGARLVTYQRALTYDAGSPYETTNGCDASFLAPPPEFNVSNVSMKGTAFECAAIVANGPGYTRNSYVPPPPSPVFYPSFGFYR